MGGSSSQVTGYRFKLRYHAGLTYGPIDALLEFRAGDRTAWSGRATTTSAITVNAPKLFGGDKDQGGIKGTLYLMMGTDSAAPLPLLQQTFGNQTAAWRGFATVAYDGVYGSNNPYPQPAAYKVEKILQGWDGGAAWYPAKAPIPIVAEGAEVTDGYFSVPAGAQYGNLDSVYGTVSADYVATAHEIAQQCFTARNLATGSAYTLDEAYVYWSGEHNWWEIGGYSVELGPGVGIAAVHVLPVCPSGGEFSFIAHGDDSPLGQTEPTVACSLTTGSNAINPAHALYYLRTQPHLGGEPTASIDEASFTAAADQLFAEGFGICVRIDPDKESPEDVENRICKLIGGSVNRSLEDGKLYLDLARGSYVLEDLRIVGDDDILDFSEQPTTPEGAVNSVSVRYFDPERKETIITPSVDALGLIDAFGLNHQVLDYPEIPTATLAARIATRELRNFITPSRVFDLVCKPTVYALRPNQYFRLQAPKRGIADMVCIVGDKQGGTLKSGAIRLQAAQDIYTLPDFGTVEVEPGVDPSPTPTPVAITHQVAFEAPYVNVVAALSRTELAALPADVGYLVAVAEDPAASRDFTLSVDAGAGYTEQADGDWAPTAVVNEAAGPADTDFTYSEGDRLDQVLVGDIVLWGSELCRVAALDTGMGTISLARGCADTTPQVHAASERLWCYGAGAAHDSTEYTDGETVAVKLLTNSFSQQLNPLLATAMSVTFDQRQARPYPPGKLRFTDATQTDVSYPDALSGDITTSWAHRDRLQQADQLLDSEAASVGPEAGTTYTVVYEQPPGTSVHTESALTGTSATPYAFATDGIARIRVFATRDGLDSRQALSHDFAYTAVAPATDPYWDYVTSLQNFGGADGSTTFTDEKGIVWTPSGNVQIDTSLGINAAQFDGSGDRLSAPGTSTGLQLSNSEPWTQEFWVRTNGTSPYQLLGNLDDNNGTGHYWIILNSTFGGLHTVQFGAQGQTCRFGTAALPTGANTHIELGFDDDPVTPLLRCFVGGVQLGSAVPLSALAANTREFLVGSGWNSITGYSPYNLNGWLIARRTTKGVCRHTANFDPPPPPFPTSA